MSLTHHPERLAGVHPLLADTLVNAWNAELDFDRLVIEGVRTPATVAENWAKGRIQLPDGTWCVVDAREVVTHVQHPEDSAHCHAGAIDVMPLVGGKLVWSQKNPQWTVCEARLQRMATVAKRLGVVWGGDFAHLVDLDHWEHPTWRQLPLVTTPTPGAAHA